MDNVLSGTSPVTTIKPFIVVVSVASILTYLIAFVGLRWYQTKRTSTPVLAKLKFADGIRVIMYKLKRKVVREETESLG